MTRPLRFVTAADVANIERAIHMLHAARALLDYTGTERARKAVQRAINSADGALRHARRCIDSRKDVRDEART